MAPESESLTRLTRYITAGYFLALSMLAALTIGIHVLLDEAVRELRDVGTVVSLAGQQRTLAVQIYWMTAELERNREETLGPLAVATEQFVTAHRDLLYGNPSLDLPDGVSEKLHSYYFEAPHNIDERVRAFLFLVRSASVTGVDEALLEDLRALLDYQLLPSLGAAVNAYESSVVASVDGLRLIQRLAIAAVILVLVLEGVFIFRPLVSRIRSYAERLYSLATRDSLTGLSNRRHFMEQASRVVAERARTGRPAAIVMLDIDRFKSVNDRFGHPVGDRVLAATAECVAGQLRPYDISGRIGGEEFATLLPDTDADAAFGVAERLREAIGALRLQAGQELRWTVSLGVAAFRQGEDLETAMKRADAALYEAKNAGRNRSRLAA